MNISQLDQKTKIRKIKLIAKAYRPEYKLMNDNLNLWALNGKGYSFKFNPYDNWSDLMPILIETKTINDIGFYEHKNTYYFGDGKFFIEGKDASNEEYRRVACDALVVKAYGDNVSEEELK